MPFVKFYAQRYQLDEQLGAERATRIWICIQPESISLFLKIVDIYI